MPRVHPIGQGKKKDSQVMEKKGVIVKMLGRTIGYKALENRLHHMWEKRGVLNIIDLGKEYYLVSFNSEKDHN